MYREGGRISYIPGDLAGLDSVEVARRVKGGEKQQERQKAPCINCVQDKHVQYESGTSSVQARYIIKFWVGRGVTTQKYSPMNEAF